MSYRISRAMGYGMPWHRFEELTTLECEAHETSEAVYQVFNDATEADLTVPKDVRTTSFGSAPSHSAIIEPRLLAKTFTDGGRRTVEFGRADDLYTTVSTPDDTTDIIFFPSLSKASDWYRHDDYLDYTFERWRDGDDRGEHSGPRNFVKYVAYGHYPYTNHVMTEDGKPHEWLPFWEMRVRPDLVADIPSEIRWYLDKLGVLDEASVNQLRPIIAQWWS